MFKFKQTIFEYSDPWTNLSYAQRLALLNPITKRIVYFYENPDNSTFRYRVYNMMNAINTLLSDEYSASFFCMLDIEHLDEIIKNCDLLILCRVKYSHKINHLLTKAKAKGIKIAYDVDDLVFNHSYTHLILNTLDQNLNESDWNSWYGMTSRGGDVMKSCDFAITTNQYLADKITEYASVPSYIIPNFLNQDQLDISQKIMQQKLESNFARDETITMGYFSGTPTHNLDFALLNEAIIRLFKKYDNLKLRMVGFMEIKGSLHQYMDRIEFIPFQDYVNLQHYIGEVEINLIPLQINTFTNCKSELKYFDAGICGTISIASPTYVYKTAIIDGENGYLANELEWETKISALIDNLNNYQIMAKKAYEHSLNNFAWYHHKETLKRTLKNI
jgi:glycosyltransferase involved in cell wall biosynthesis